MEMVQYYLNKIMKQNAQNVLIYFGSCIASVLKNFNWTVRAPAFFVYDQAVKSNYIVDDISK